MTQGSHTYVPGGLEDPRSRPEFLSHYYPSANGKDPPAVNAAGRNEQIMLEFLAVYYRLNCAYARLCEVRKTASPERSQQERECMQAIEKVLILRDALEDRYAPYGVIAEPVAREGFAVDVEFSFGSVDAAGRPRSELYTITAYVPIPLPPGMRLDQLPLKIEGPGIPPN